MKHYFLKTYNNIDFKKYNFSIILKNFNTLITKNLSTFIVKNFKTLGNNVVKIFKFIDFKKYDLKKIYKYLDIRRFGFTKIIKYFESIKPTRAKRKKDNKPIKAFTR